MDYQLLYYCFLFSFFLLGAVLLIALLDWFLNTRILSRLYKLIQYMYAILYNKILNLFGLKKSTQSLSITFELQELETLSELFTEKSPAQPMYKQPKLNLQKSSKSTSSKKRKRDSLGRFTK